MRKDIRRIPRDPRTRSGIMIVVGRFIKVKSSSNSTIMSDQSISPVYPPFSFYNTPRNASRPSRPFNFLAESNFYPNFTQQTPPERLPADYVEMAVLIAMVLIGGPLNFVSLFRSLKSNPPLRIIGWFDCCRDNEVHTGPTCAKSSRQFDLKIHLTIANLLVIWVYALSDLCWLATYSWRGGDFMCRVVRFVHAFCFYATSNLISTIAIQRLTVAMKLDRPPSRRGRSSVARVSLTGLSRVCHRTSLAYGAWTLAFLCSVPQLIIWRTFQLYPGWAQCVTTFTIERYNQQEDTGDPIQQHQLELDAEKQEKIYNGFHLAFVFWIPVLTIFVCYVLTVSRFHRRIRTQTRQIEAEATAEAESRAASVRASLVLGGPVDAGSPLLLPIAVSRALQYQTMEPGVVGAARTVALQQQRRSVVLRRVKKTKLACPPFGNRLTRFGSSSRVDSVSNDEEYDQSGIATASILNATLIGAARPYARKSFAIATLSRAKKRTMKKTIWILLSYLLCWSPYNVLVLWRYVDRDVDLYDFEILYNLIVLHAVINPLIYGV